MKLFAAIAGLAGTLAALSVPAHATLYDWSYTGTGNFGSGITSDIASGTLTTGAATTGLGGAGYTITAISGTYNGAAITGLLPPNTCCTPPPNNNVLYYPAAPYLDFAGLGFATNYGPIIQVDLYYNGPNYGDDARQMGGAVETVGYGDFTVSPASTVPEPASLALLGAGLAGLGFVRRRRAA